MLEPISTRSASQPCFHCHGSHGIILVFEMLSATLSQVLGTWSIAKQGLLRRLNKVTRVRLPTLERPRNN